MSAPEKAAPAHTAEGWQPIDTAPKTGQPFIAANQMYAFRAFWDSDFAEFMDEDSQACFSELEPQVLPTHWMPLPPVPSLDAKGEPGKGE